MSTRKVDDLVKALGAASGISKSEVSRICAALDKGLEEFGNRPLDDVAFPYVYHLREGPGPGHRRLASYAKRHHVRDPTEMSNRQFTASTRSHPA